MRVFSISVLLLALSLTYATIITNDTSVIQKSYEYIIIGGGTTALAIANRLSVQHTVLVIERGMDEMNAEGINDPFTPFSATSGSVTCHKSGTSPPQVGSKGSEARVQAVTYGNCLGGSSSINAMIATRPVKAGMDAIEALGNPGWGWEDFLPFMIKSETFGMLDAEQIADGASFNKSVHGFSGPVGVSFARPMIAPETQQAAKNTTAAAYGMSLSEDLGDGFSGGHFQSFYHHIHFNETLGKDRRSSSAWSYLYPESQKRGKLTVLTEHVADKIVTKTGVSGVTATGVMVLPSVGGNTMIFNATKEVVVSAGALFSPGVLLRSGIGETKFLQGLGITPILDISGVGANFQDQALLVNISFPIANPANMQVTGGPNILLGVVLGEMTGRSAFGPNGNELVANMVRNATSDITLAFGGVVSQASFAAQMEVTAVAYEQSHPMAEVFYTPGATLSIWTQSILPLSRGTVLINSTDPLAFPVVNAQYLTVQSDVDIFTRAARLLGKAAATKPFSDLITADAYALSGMPPVNASDAAWTSWMLDKWTPGVHFVGSASMLPQALGGVVSPQLVIYGTINIRVADASVMPLSVFPHCTLGLYGIGEKAADMILKHNLNDH